MAAPSSTTIHVTGGQVSITCRPGETEIRVVHSAHDSSHGPAPERAPRPRVPFPQDPFPQDPFPQDPLPQDPLPQDRFPPRNVKHVQRRERFGKKAYQDAQRMLDDEMWRYYRHKDPVRAEAYLDQELDDYMQRRSVQDS